MKLIFALLISFLSCPVFAANPAIYTAFRLDAGETSYTINNSGSVGTTPLQTFKLPSGWTQAGIVLTPGVYVPPTSTTTFTACAAPCGIGATVGATTINMQLGQSYRWLVKFDGSGNISSPFTVTSVGGAYAANACNSTGTIPIIESTITTTSPLPMPREVVGQDCSIDRTRLTLQSPHASTGIRLFIRIHSPIYDALLPNRIDGKIEVQINSGVWQILNNANSNITAADETKYQVLDNSGNLKKFGGSAKVRDYILAIPNGTIGSGDTTVDIAWRFRGTDGKTSGSRILEMVLIESTDCDMTNIAKTGTASIGTCNSHGFSSGDDILVRGAPGERMVFNGMRHLSGVTTNTFTFANCDYSSGGSKLTSCVLSDGNWAPPINRDPNTNTPTQQAHMYASRMLVARSAFTYTDPSTWVAPVAGNSTRGGCYFTTSTFDCTAAQHNLSNSNLAYLNNKINAQCSNCHSPTGGDVKYYAFSNESIKVRSIFHGFSEQAGDDIAAYIRGNAIAVPTQARPWNPPFQTGPGMANGTFTKAATTLTSIVVSSNVGTFTVPGGHGYTTGQPVTTWGATVDTDLNATCTITVTNSIVFTCPTTSVANGTYTESTLQITMANDIAAGCGVDCVTTYGYKDMLDSFSDTSKWVFTSNIEPRTITWPYQFPDWNTNWLPAVWPGDSYPTANYTSSTPYTFYLSLLSGVTPGSFSSFQSNTYGLSSGKSILQLVQEYVGNDAPQQYNSFSQYKNDASVSDVAIAPSQWNIYRNSVFQAAAIQTWTMAVEYKLIGLYGQAQVAINGTPSATGCNPPWGILGKADFYFGPHVEKMYTRTVGDGYDSTFQTLSNAWYIATPGINSGACYAIPGGQIDSSYLEKFLDFTGIMRASGYSTVIMEAILSMQAGRNDTVFDFINGASRDGTDWGGPLRRNVFGYNKAQSYWWFTASDYAALVNLHLSIVVAAINGQDAAHWRTAIDNMYPDYITSTTNCDFQGTSGTAQAAYRVYLPGGSLNPCNFAASNLTMWTLFGANSTNITTVKNWAATLFPSHNFQLDIDAATEGDTGDYGTGNLTATGSHVITFSTKCPTVTNGLLIAGGGALSEIPTITSNSCTPGATGTITVTTTIAHPNGWKATGGCSTVSLYPNNDLGLSSEWFRCKNMYP